MSVKVSNLPPIDEFSLEDEIIVKDFSETDVKKKIKRGSLLLLQALLGPGSGGGGTVITDSTIISNITTPSNYKDSYGNQADLGGFYDGPDVTGNEGDYYIEPPTGTPGEVKYSYTLRFIGLDLKPIKVLYFS